MQKTRKTKCGVAVEVTGLVVSSWKGVFIDVWRFQEKEDMLIWARPGELLNV